MMVEGESIHKPVRTRLQFTPSTELNESMVEFLQNDVRDRMARRAVSLSLFSVQSVELQLEQGNEMNAADIVADDKYEASVAGMQDHEFHLTPQVRRDEQEGGIVLQFMLNLRNRERMRLVQPPLFPPGYRDDIKLYTLLPRERLLGGQAVNVAFTRLRRRLGADRNDGSKIAPWEIYATHSRVFHRWEYPRVAQRDDDDRLSRYLDNI